MNGTKSTGLVRAGGTTALAGLEWSPETVRLLREQIAPDLTPAEMDVFLAVCRHRGLNPLDPGQIYAIKRRDRESNSKKMVIQTGVDGFRLMAERTGQYIGQTQTYWAGRDGRWSEVWLGDGPPSAAKVGVKRRDWPETQWAVARLQSYVQRVRRDNGMVPTSQWQKMPDVMLAKCAEVLAFRKAFPQIFDNVLADVEVTTDEHEEHAPRGAGPVMEVDGATGEILRDPNDPNAGTAPPVAPAMPPAEVAESATKAKPQASVHRRADEVAQHPCSECGANMVEEEGTVCAPCEAQIPGARERAPAPQESAGQSQTLEQALAEADAAKLRAALEEAEQEAAMASMTPAQRQQRREQVFAELRAAIERRDAEADPNGRLPFDDPPEPGARDEPDPADLDAGGRA